MAPRQLTGNTRRLTQEGVTPGAAERALSVIERSLLDAGQLTRRQLGERIAAAGVRTEGQALVHILGLASLRGMILRGPMLGAEHAYVLVRDWLGDGEQTEREAALRELALRYLTGHGPADERDLARWSGLPLRDARSGLEAIAKLLAVRPDGLVDLAGRPAAEDLPPPRLLGAFDPILLGWCSREQIVGRHLRVVTVNGIFRPIALVEGRACATWSMPSGRVLLEALEPLSRAQHDALAKDAVEVERFLGTGDQEGERPACT